MTRNISRCAVGQVMYSPWCDTRGKVLDDGTISRLEEDVFRVTAADPNLRWFQDNSHGLRVTIEDVSEPTAALAVQGPASRAVLERASGDSLGSLSYYRLRRGRIGNADVTISRTGYTGDLGYEIWLDARQAEEVWDRVREAGDPYGLTPTGILALDIARIEAGLLLIEVDYISSRRALIESQKSSPFEVGLGWAVALDKPVRFVGQEALRREKQHGSPWAFVGLEVSWPALESLYAEVGLPVQLPSTAWRSGTPIYAEGRYIGRATSGCWSPILKKLIALGQIETGWSRPGTEVSLEMTVEHVRRQATAVIVRPPFFNPPRKKG
jgi:aminomethyltransferase